MMCFDTPSAPNAGRHLKPTSDGRKYFCSCGKSGRVLDAVRKARKLPNARLFALQFECPNCKVLACKCPEQEDLALYRRASELLQEMRSSLPIPSLEIVKSEETCRIINYGYARFEQLFNDRQVLSLGLLLREILRTKDQNVMEFLLLAFSKCLEFNNILVPYVYSGNKVESCFSLHEYLHAQVYVENNVWGARHGRGTFVKCYKNVYRGKEYCESPYERVYEEAKGKIVVKSIPTEPRIEARLVEHFSELNSKQQTALLRCENAENLSFVPPSSVDLVLTDPPYFDNVIYSGLADFFYAWLRPVLASRYSWMSDIQKSPKEEEIVVNKGNPSKNEETYLDAMTRVFKECARVLKRDGIMVFTFHHTKKRAWSSIISALLAAGFYVSSAWPVHSESRASPHATPGSIQFDVILTCRRRDGDGETIEWRNLRNKAEHQAKQIIDKLTGKRPSLSQEDVKTIVLGKCMELYSKHYPNVLSSGETLTAWEAIRRMETTAGSLARKRLTKDNS